MMSVFKMNVLGIFRCLHRNYCNLRNYSDSFVKIVEVGPRDGLQNESVFVPTEKKIEFINKLSNTGLSAIEVTSFVSPKWVKQMSDNKEVFQSINKHTSLSYPVLVPNVKGLTDAIEVGAKEIAVFASASEGFARKNTNASVDEILCKIKEVTNIALPKKLKIRGYVSCVVGCPYDGFIKPSTVSRITETLFNLGCYEVSLGDTIGVGTKATISDMLKDVTKVASPEKLAIHCHDTYGQGLVNICIALEYGIKVVDASVSGLGGCPYAKGATGNVATEDVVYMLHGMGLETKVDLNALINAGRFICDTIKRPTGSKVNQAVCKTS